MFMNYMGGPTPESVHEDNFDNQIVLLDEFLPKNVLLDGCPPGRIWVYNTKNF